MKDNNPIKLDKKDKSILQILEANSRESYASIGKKVGLSIEAVDYRIKKYYDSGLIYRLFAEPNLAKLGLKTYRLYLKVENITQKEEDELISYFMNHPKGQFFAEVEGLWDYIMRYTLKNEDELKNEIDTLMGLFGKYIKAKNIAITTQQTYLPITYFTGRSEFLPELNTKIDSIYEPDILDKKILYSLFENSRMKTTDLALKLKVSPDTIQYRIKKLLNSNVISYFGAYFNCFILGYSRYKVLFWLQYTTKEREEKFVNFCISHPNAIYFNRLIGDWDIELEIDAKDIQELRNILKNIRNRFSDIIRDYSVLTILKENVPNPFRENM